MNGILHIGDWIHDLAKRLKQETEAGLSGTSLGQGQFLLLLFLLRQAGEEPLYQEEIAQAMGLNKANVSRIVARLRDKDLLEVMTKPGTGRRHQVRLKTRALELKDEMAGQFQAIHQRMVKGIDEEKLAITAAVLRQMLSNLKESGEE
jgi:DNA-binding MarR family transcriptional regulator